VTWAEAGKPGEEVVQRAPVKFNAKAYASQHAQPAECEAAARDLLSTSREQGWAVLRACVDRGNFTALRRLLSEQWLAELQVRKDAPLLIARVIAARGGSIATDLRVLQDNRVPVFSLAAAMAQPEVYKGKYVVFRASPSQVRMDKGAPTVRLAEMSLGSEGSDVAVGHKNVRQGSSYASGRASYNTSRFGSGSIQGSRSGRTESASFKTETRYSNIASETGREAFGKLAEADPFLEPGKEFVMLGRFDGVRSTSAAESSKETVAVLSIVAYYPPNPVIVY
jgi:hypothetical protein